MHNRQDEKILALAQIKSLDFAGALESLNSIGDISGDYECLGYRGIAKAGLNLHKEALIDLDVALPLLDKRAQYYHIMKAFRGMARLNDGDDLVPIETINAIDDLDYGINKIRGNQDNPLLPLLLRALGKARYKCGMLRSAYQDFSDVLKINPFDLESLEFYGVINFEICHYVTALRNFNSIIKIKESPIILAYRAITNFKIGYTTKALENLKTACNLDPNNQIISSLKENLEANDNDIDPNIIIAEAFTDLVKSSLLNTVQPNKNNAVFSEIKEQHVAQTSLSNNNTTVQQQGYFGGISSICVYIFNKAYSLLYGQQQQAPSI